MVIIPVHYYLQLYTMYVILLMRLNCNLGKVNLKTTLEGQQLSPRNPGLCRVVTGTAGAYM